MKKQIYCAAMLLALAGACSDSKSNTTGQQVAESEQSVESQPAGGSISEEQTKQVLDHHWQAFTQNDLEAVMADYTEESVLITPDNTYKGLEEIRKNFENAFAKFPKDKSTFGLNKSVTDRDVAYILWQAKTPTFDLTYATDTFVVRDGKIVRQTYAGVANPISQ